MGTETDHRRRETCDNTMKTDLNDECKNLELIINDLVEGRETCEIGDDRFTLEDVLVFLRGYLQELKDLNERIIVQGNTSELMEEVSGKYMELWMFQSIYTIQSLPRVIGPLMSYPDEYDWRYGI